MVLLCTGASDSCTQIESSNQSVLKISYLENYIFLTNTFFNIRYMDKFI